MPTRRSRSALALVAAALGSACGDPPAPPVPELEARWVATARAVLDSVSLDRRERSRVEAVAALASYEGHAADVTSGLRSLAGQVNGLWNIPLARGAVDGAIASAEAQRVVLDALLLSRTESRARFDSLSAAQLSARREARVPRAVAERSVAHGAAIGRRLLEWLPAAQPTLVLRHVRECSFAPPRDRSIPPARVIQAGAASAVAPASVAEAAERRVLQAMLSAEIAASATPDEDCVRERVGTRLRTRSPEPVQR